MLTTTMNKITILQHNIDHWHFGLYNTYRHIDADIILLNHTGLIDNAPLRIQQYTVYTKNIKNDIHRGTAIAIKSHIRHRIHNDFYTDLLAVTIYSRQRPMTIATDYIAPNATYLDTGDYYKLFSRKYPVYLFGNLNAEHKRLLKTSGDNVVGDALAHMNEKWKILQYLGPDFPTLMRDNCSTAPDIALANLKTFHDLHLAPGPATASDDHIPVIITISCHAIQKLNPTRRQ